MLFTSQLFHLFVLCQIRVSFMWCCDMWIMGTSYFLCAHYDPYFTYISSPNTLYEVFEKRSSIKCWYMTQNIVYLKTDNSLMKCFLLFNLIVDNTVVQTSGNNIHSVRINENSKHINVTRHRFFCRLDLILKTLNLPLKVYNLYMKCFDMVYSEQNTFKNALSSTLDMFS
jgi:hypothetical protein